MTMPDLFVTKEEKISFPISPTKLSFLVKNVDYFLGQKALF